MSALCGTSEECSRNFSGAQCDTKDVCSYVFRSGPQYLRSALWSFILDGYSVKWEVCIDLSEVRADRYQRSVDFRELHTDVWEVATDIQEGRSDV